MGVYQKVQPYAVLTIPLTTGNTLASVGQILTSNGLPLQNWVANSFFINTLTPSAVVSFGLQDFTGQKFSPSGMFDGNQGLRMIGVPFSGLYITNPAQPGASVQVILAWIE